MAATYGCKDIIIFASMKTTNERILFMITHFCEGSKAEFARIMEEKPQTINSWLKRNNGNGVLNKILKKFPMVSPAWLFTGEGEMLLSTTPTEKTEEVFNTDEYRLLQSKFNALLDDYKELKKEAVPLNPNAVLYVPLVNQYAYAGYLNGYQNETYMNTLPTIPFIADHEGHGNYIAFEVKGDSMNDGTEESYLEGDRLLCREVQPHLWVNSRLHIKKWDFVIVHEEGIIVKRITDHDVENHTITVHSLNEMYPDRVIDLSEVKQIFNVIEMQRPRRR